MTFWYSCSVLYKHTRTNEVLRKKGGAKRSTTSPLSQPILSKLHKGSLCFLLAGCADGLLVWRWDGETHRRDHGLIPRGADHLPLGPLRVVFQHTLLASVYCDLRGAAGETGWMQVPEEQRAGREGIEVMRRMPGMRKRRRTVGETGNVKREKAEEL